MYYLLSMCDFGWLLPWLLPFLLGLLAGWAIWGHWRKRVNELEENLRSYETKLNKSNASLDVCLKNSSKLEGEIKDLKQLKTQDKGKKNNDSKWKNELDSMSKKNKDLELKIASLQSITDRHQNAQEALRTEKEKTAALETEINALKAAAASAVTLGTAGVASSLTATNDKKEDSSKSKAIPSAFAKLKSSNLQIIEGIGPKMEEVLHDAGIKDWSILASKTPEELRSLLDDASDRYKIIDPTTWPKQAKLASKGKWEKLIQLQKELDTGVANAAGITDSKLEKLIETASSKYKKFKKDDLTIVEGIGPKISELLQQAGIDTWAKLGATDPEKIKEILKAGGPRFGLAEPRTWPQQATLADQGKWESLDKLQDELDGGK